METVEELLRLPSPAPKPQSIAFDGTTLWMGSRETRRLYAIDPNAWTVRETADAPGTPWGMVALGDEFRVVTGEAPDDDRFIRRFVPGHGFGSTDRLACPDDTGSQLSYDGERLYLSQWYRKRILALDAAGAVTRTIQLDREIVGHVVVGGRFYVVTPAAESTADYLRPRGDARGEVPAVDHLARIGFPARGLTFDGERFWTNHREADQIVAFRTAP